MVVAVERINSSEKIKSHTGNDLRLSILDNKRTLVITGNNCIVKLKENSGLVKVIGDSCELTVLGGSGSIEYIGNNGKIRLGYEVSEDVVIYVGNKGEITFDKNSLSMDSNKPNKKKHDLKMWDKVKKPKETLVNICNSSNVWCIEPVLSSDVRISSPNIKISKHRLLKTIHLNM